MRKRQQPRAIGEQPFELRFLQHTALRVHPPFAHRDSERREAPPAAAVSLVILVGNDHLIARLEQAAEGLRQHVRVLRGRRAEVHFLRRNAKIFGEAFPRCVHPLAGLGGGGEGVVGLHFQPPIVFSQAVHYRSAGVRTAGVFEERLAGQGGFAERRKLTANESDIELHRAMIASTRYACHCMSLDRTRYEALVRRMEEFAQRSPRLYRWWILALAALGYAYLLVLVVALLALLVASVYGLRTATAMLSVKLFFVVGALLLVVLRSLWVTLKPPGGEPLVPRDAPAFFERLDQLSARLKAPRIHDVLITEDFNAAVCQMPRLGVFGWHRNYLLVGLPLMKCLTVLQLEAVLAHELGHLSRGHARVGNWIYRLRLVWQRLDEAFAAKPQRGAGVIRAFLRWYIPYFAGCSFPLARNNEFEADASSVQLTSPLAAAQALTNVSVLGSYLQQRYWPAINAGARDSAQPAFAPFSALNAATLALSAAE